MATETNPNSVRRWCEVLDLYESIGRFGGEPLDLKEGRMTLEELVETVDEHWVRAEVNVGPLLQAAPFSLKKEFRYLADGRVEDR
ncbi:MAG: hypothetical protein U5R46_09630 [Gammaproteobacteria bacterium]|nr:hypothetical protein [Gammaproteobacteria bacterium]